MTLCYKRSFAPANSMNFLKNGIFILINYIIPKHILSICTINKFKRRFFYIDTYGTQFFLTK